MNKNQLKLAPNVVLVFGRNGLPLVPNDKDINKALWKIVDKALVPYCKANTVERELIATETLAKLRENYPEARFVVCDDETGSPRGIVREKRLPKLIAYMFVKLLQYKKGNMEIPTSLPRPDHSSQESSDDEVIFLEEETNKAAAALSILRLSDDPNKNSSSSAEPPLRESSNLQKPLSDSKPTASNKKAPTTKKKSNDAKNTEEEIKHLNKENAQLREEIQQLREKDQQNQQLQAFFSNNNRYQQATIAKLEQKIARLEKTNLGLQHLLEAANME